MVIHIKLFPFIYDQNTYIKTRTPYIPIDITLTLADYDDLLTTSSLSTLQENQYVWIGNNQGTWSVLKYTNTDQQITSVIKDGSTITVNTLTTANMQAGEIFVVNANGTDYVLKCSCKFNMLHPLYVKTNKDLFKLIQTV